MYRILPVVGIAVAVMLLCAPVGSACPMCANAVSEGGTNAAGNVPLGFFYSIMFMLSMPFLLLGGFSAMFYHLHRKAHPLRHHVARDMPTAEPVPAA